MTSPKSRDLTTAARPTIDAAPKSRHGYGSGLTDAGRRRKRPNYYNEHDKFAANWLRNLIDAGLIAPGVVDERSIEDVSPSDLDGFTQCHFFAGIGGWPYALRLAGWPDDRPIWTGSCPCQPFSTAGQGKGVDDPRHLWPAFRWLLAQCRPATVGGEQVASADGRGWLNGVRADLEALGYVVGSADLCAAGVGAPQRRQRLFWMADAAGERRDGCAGAAGQDRRAGAQDNGADGGLEHPAGNGRQQRRAESIGGSIERGCRQSALNGLAHANGNGCDQGGRSESATGLHGTLGDGGTGGLGDAIMSASERLGVNGGQILSVAEPGGPSSPGAWGDFEIVWCDERELGNGWVPRRVESGTFPLAHGVSDRVGRLRGYGNAIVPELAAEFVRAYMEATP